MGDVGGERERKRRCGRRRGDRVNADGAEAHRTHVKGQPWE